MHHLDGSTDTQLRNSSAMRLTCTSDWKKVDLGLPADLLVNQFQVLAIEELSVIPLVRYELNEL